MKQPQNTGSVYRPGPKGRMEDETRHAFGLFDETMIPKLRWILQQFGLRLIVKRNSREWGDQVFVSIQGSKTAAVLGSLGGAALAKRRTAEERSESARKAAQARWANRTEGERR